ncbi:MAG: FAD-dependent monooxygenase [Betaproteobacteria bacterium]|jgi:2-polyprenyl-6-methoxyphenol hydroxylase-like FAD-dependent oxidoreductase|nr:FAD-dependent monooxygenase [Betaproteobacteria bacterium]
MDTDVLIVGAGPTGLMLANQLGRRGVRVLIIDRHAQPSRETKALGVQARTLEIYSRLGIVDRALELGKRGTGGNIWAEGRHMARVSLGDAGESVTPYPYILILGQDDNERIMGDKLHDWGVAVQWRTELVGLQQAPDNVAATLKLPDGTTRTVTANRVAGCDGAHSAVRELSGITFPGAPYEHVFFVADTEVTGSMVPDEVNVFLWREGFHLFFPMRGKDHWRIVGILPPALRDKDDVKFESVIPALRGEAGDLSFKACTWFSTYRIHHRSAARFRDRRCFLLGDAAHIHSPVGAQGMNTGLQDAYNLGWKLALVVQGRADAALVDSYEDERVPVARRLLNTTDRAFRLIVSDNPLAGIFRTQVLARIAAFAVNRKPIQRFAFRVISQTGIHYRKSSLSETLSGLPHGAPQAGDRFPWLRVKSRTEGPVEDLFAKLDDTRLALILIGQPAPPDAALALGDLLRIHAIPADPVNDAELARAKIPSPSFYLLRPDGHVGLCGIRLETDTVTRYASGRLRLGRVSH